MLYTLTPGFYQFPQAVGSCVKLSTDATTSSSPGCSSCGNSTLTSSTCTVYQANGLSYSVCSQATDGNKPSVTSCYVGTFSPSLVSVLTTQCSKVVEFCQVRTLNFYSNYYDHDVTVSKRDRDHPITYLPL